MSAGLDLFNPPEKLSSTHDLSQFHCGEPALDDWLRKRARQNEESGASRTYVVCVGKRVMGYYALAVGAVAHVVAPGRVRRNMPEPVPVMVLGRLAVDETMQGGGVGPALLRDAVLRTLQAAIFVSQGNGEVCPASWELGKETLTPGLALVSKI